MGLTLETVQQMAPDQRSLAAAGKLIKPSKWPLLASDAARGVAWGECQGSGATPYRVCLTLDDLGYKCTCPSRKFPCKHTLGLMWLIADQPAAVADGVVPEWVEEWLGRRRKKGTGVPAGGAVGTKDIRAVGQPEAAVDPKVAERRARAAEKAAETRRGRREDAVSGGLDELEVWLGDVLAEGLGEFPSRAVDRCRKVASRLVDAQAPALATWLDELPARLFQQPDAARTDWLLEELGRLALLIKAVRALDRLPEDLRHDVRARIGWTVSRDALLDDADAVRVRDVWTVLGVRTVTQVDRLIRHETWLRRHGAGAPEWALLLDFVPVVGGARPPYRPGEVIEAELVYHRSAWPLRAQLVRREPTTPEALAVAALHGALVGLDAAVEVAQHAIALRPWLRRVPVVVEGVRVGRLGTRSVLVDAEGRAMLPIADEANLGLTALAGAGAVRVAALLGETGVQLLAADTVHGWWDPS